MQVLNNNLALIIDKTYEIIKPLVDEINEHSKCEFCGGNCANFTCLECAETNKDLEILIRIISKYLRNFQKEVTSLQIRISSPNKLFNLLYSITGIHIDVICEFLKRFDYDTIIDQVYCEEIEKIKKNEEISKENIETIMTLFQRSDRDLYPFFQYFMVRILNQFYDASIKNLISFDFVCAMIKNFVTSLIGNYYPNPSCFFMTKSEIKKRNMLPFDDTTGVTAFGTTIICYEVVEEFFKKGSNSIFFVIFHELTHTKHFARVYNGKIISNLALLETMDYILRQFLPDYHKENYNSISYEIEANYNGIIKTTELMERLGFTISREVLMQIETLTIEYQKQMYNRLRVYHGCETSIDEIFGRFILDKPELLEEYHQLKYLYKLLEGNVIPKTKEELQGDWESIANDTNISEENKNSLKTLYQNLLGGSR